MEDESSHEKETPATRGPVQLSFEWASVTINDDCHHFLLTLTHYFPYSDPRRRPTVGPELVEQHKSCCKPYYPGTAEPERRLYE